MIFLDTHVALWMYFGEDTQLSKTCKETLDQEEDLFISPLVLLETAFLNEIGKIELRPEKLEKTMQKEFRISSDSIVLDDLVYHSLDLSWTRDPFDRMLVAHCIARGGRLLTKDGEIARNFEGSVW